jgi:hypothetical protein
MAENENVMYVNVLSSGKQPFYDDSTQRIARGARDDAQVGFGSQRSFDKQRPL